jgi:hypothetical protein
MKNLTLTVFVILFSFITLSQTFVFDVKEIISYKAKGDLSYNETKQNSYWETPLEPIDCKYEINIDKKTSTFYHNGVKINTLNIIEINKNGDVYVIKIKDYNVFNPSDIIITTYTINVKEMSFYMSWFVPNTNVTRAQFHTKIKSYIK